MIKYWDKYVYTTLICINHTAFAMCFTAISPVLTEMIDILHTSTEWMTLFSTFTSIGFLIGSLLGFLIKYLNRQLFMITFLVIMAIATTFIPYSPNLYSLYICAIFLGMGSGVVNCVLNVWLTELGGERSGAFLQIPGFTFGVGTILSPLIIKPYLRDKQDQLNTTTTISSTTIIGSGVETMKLYSSAVDEEENRSLLKTPFLILGSFQLLFPILLLVMFVVKRYENKAQTLDKSDESDVGKKLFDRQRRHRIPALLLFGVMVGSFMVYESSYYTFAVTYFQYSPLLLSATQAADVITAFTALYAGFRAIAIFVAIKVQPKYILVTHFTISALGIVCLLFARKNMTVLWVANVILGIGCSAVMQSIFAFVGQHMKLDDIVGTIMIVFMSSFNIAPPYIIGRFIKTFSDIFLISESLALTVCIITFGILLAIIWKTEKTEKSMNNKIDN